MRSFQDTLVSIAGAANVRPDEPLSAHTTFRVGGPADFLVSPETPDQVAQVLRACAEAGVECRIMGRGSNLLVADAGVRGVVVQVAGNLGAVSVEGDAVVAQAGASNAKVAATACRASLSGYEFAAGIPGTVGGAAMMNAGAYGGEFAQVAEAVTCLTATLDVVEVPADRAGWGYRRSALADEGMTVLAARIRLQPGSPEAIRARMDDLARRRAEKQPIDMPSAGSTFKRPEGHFAGKLVQDAGLQGHAVGGAMVSTKHAGFVVNAGGATAADVLQVIRDVRARVLAESGVLLQPEVRLWGFPPDALDQGA